MKARHTLAAVALLLACLGAKNHEDGYSLLWKPKEGQAMSYDVTTDVSAEGSKISILAELEVKVSKVAANGDYTVETAHKHVRVVTDGEEHASPDADKEAAVTYNAKGEQISEVVAADEPDEVTALLGSVGNVSPPHDVVHKGDTWTEDIKADEKKRVKAARVTYEVTGTDKVGAYDVVVVTMKYKQTEGSKPASYEGSIALDITDMSLVKVEALVQNVPLDEETPGEVKLKIIRR